METHRRRFLQFCAGAVALPAVSRIAAAQTYPTRPITLIVPFAAGSPTDVIARVVAEPMKKSLGQPVIIENVTGAEGSLGVGRVARARPDGYTIDIGSNGPHVLNGAFYSLQYDLLNDFAPIAPLATVSGVLFTRKTLPAWDLHELIAWLKANPNTAAAGVGASFTHLLTALFRKETGTRFAFVPYRGTAPAVQDVVAGQIDFAFGATDALSLMRSGRIKAYAVTSDARLTQAPDIPTFGEMGLPALTSSTWLGLFAPKGTPKDVVGKLNAAAVETLDDKAVRSRFADLGFESVPRDQQTPEALAALQKADAAKWWPLIKELGIKAE
jgi:tripartite-type tricarboxylate transporter receptor subunit TctC